MLEFKQLLILFTFIVTLISLALFRSYNSERYIVRTLKKSNIKLALLISLILGLLPGLLHKSFYVNSFAEPDPYTYIHDTNIIVRTGYLKPEEISANDYYKCFPVFELLLSIIRIATSLDITLSYLLLNVASFILLLICMLVILPHSLGYKANGITLVLSVFILLGNSIIYGKVWNVFTPSLLAQIPFLALLSMIYKNHKSYSIDYVLLLIFGLAHGLLLPMYFLVLLFYRILLSYKSSHTAKHVTRTDIKNINWRVIVMPLLLWSSYLLISYVALLTIFKFSKTLYDHLKITLLKLDEGITFATPFHRPFAFLNAIGPSLIVGVNTAYVINTLYLRILKRVKTDNFLDALSFLTIFLLGVYSLFQFLKASHLGWSGGGYYFGVYGFFLSMIVTILIVRKTFNSINLSKKVNLIIPSVFLFTFVFLAPIGTLLDPLAFPAPNNSLLLPKEKVMKLNILVKFMQSYSKQPLRIFGDVKTLKFIESLAISGIFLPSGTRTKLTMEFESILRGQIHAEALKNYCLIVDSDIYQTNNVTNVLSIVYHSGYQLLNI